MKLVGICKIFKLEEVSPKCAKGQIYFSTKRGEDENGNAEFETSFINARVVGKAKKQLDELANAMDVEKLKNRDYRVIIQISILSRQSKTMENIYRGCHL